MHEQQKEISVERAIRSKYKGWVPPFIISGLKRLVEEAELNRLCELHPGVGGVSFAETLMREWNVRFHLHNEKILSSIEEQQKLFFCNHPLGGLDGILLSAWMGRHFGAKGFYVLVNDLLMQVRQFSDIFVPVNKHGQQSRALCSSLQECIQAGRHGLTFPAGLCSRQQDDGSILDPPWRPSFVRMAKRHRLTLVPLFFNGRNSNKFYRLARWRKRLRIPFNIEMTLLPKEMLAARGKTYHLYVGNPIAPDDIPDRATDLKPFIRQLRSNVYQLSQQ